MVFIEHISEQPANALSIATWIQALVRLAEPQHTASIAAVYPASGLGQYVYPTSGMRDAFVVVDPTTSALLLKHWAWHGGARPWTAATWATIGVSDQLRCLSLAQFEALCDEYTTWQRTLVQRNILAAKAKAQGQAIPTEAPAPSMDYPLGTIVAFVPQDATSSEAKARLAAFVPNGIDYVDMTPTSTMAYARCSTADAATKLVQYIGPSSYILQTNELATYWSRIPQRVRNAALKRSLKDTRMG